MDSPAVNSVHDLRRLVERRFSVYDAQYDDAVAAFYVNVDAATVETEFEGLRQDLKPHRYIPLLKYQGGEHAVYVVERPNRNHRSRRVNLALFVITWITTTLAGATIHFGYANPGLDVSRMTAGEFFAAMFTPGNLLLGFLLYAIPLMAILTVHEFGHYIAARRHGMEASLPFFIPLPPFLAAIDIGTLGAFISMREPIPNRKALLDIGVSGPIAGFVVAIPVLLLGMFFMRENPVIMDDVSGLPILGTPLLYNLLAAPFNFPENQVIHPTALAGWVGLFVTAINLLPAGQLDGGHMASALLGDRARYLSYAAVILLVILGFGIPGVVPQYSGWLVFALLVSLLGLQHPPTLDGVSHLDGTRRLVGTATFGLFLLCFTPVPIGL